MVLFGFVEQMLFFRSCSYIFIVADYSHIIIVSHLTTFSFVQYISWIIFVVVPPLSLCYVNNIGSYYVVNKCSKQCTASALTKGKIPLRISSCFSVFWATLHFILLTNVLIRITAYLVSRLNPTIFLKSACLQKQLFLWVS